MAAIYYSRHFILSFKLKLFLAIQIKDKKTKTQLIQHWDASKSYSLSS